MNVRALMIGDWVSVGPEACGEFGTVAGIDGSNIYVKHAKTGVIQSYSDTCIGPIVISPDILRNNDFEATNDRMFRWYGLYRVEYYKYYGRLIVKHRDAGYPNIDIMGVDCVNTLQQALRLVPLISASYEFVINKA